MHIISTSSIAKLSDVYADTFNPNAMLKVTLEQIPLKSGVHSYILLKAVSLPSCIIPPESVFDIIVGMSSMGKFPPDVAFSNVELENVIDCNVKVSSATGM